MSVVKNGGKSKNIPLIVMTAFVFIILFVLALSGNMRNTLMPQIKETYGINLTEVGFFSATLSIGMLLSSFVSGLIGDRFKKKTILAILFPVYTIFLFLIGTVPVFPLLTLCMLLLGMFSNLIMMVGNTFVAEIFSDKKAMGLNLLHTVWAIGQFDSPMYVTFMFNRGYHWSSDYSTWAFAAVAIAVLFHIALYVTRYDTGKKGGKDTADGGADMAGADADMADGADGNNAGGGSQVAAGKPKISYLSLLKEKYLLLICLFAFLQQAFQNSLMIWMPLYFDNIGYDAAVMGNLITLLWVGMTVGRIIYSIFSTRIDMILYLKIVSIVAPCVMFVCLYINAYWLWLIMLPTFGVLISAIYPLGVAITCELYPGRATAATAVKGITGSVGSMIMNPIIGSAAETVGFTFAMCVPAAMYLFAFFVITAAKFPIQKKSAK